MLTILKARKLRLQHAKQELQLLDARSKANKRAELQDWTIWLDMVRIPLN